MKIKYDHQLDALYIDLADGKSDHSEEVKPGIVFDFDTEGRLVGIEILDVKDTIAPGLTIMQAAK
jgi:uncharacterized protein YuzE